MRHGGVVDRQDLHGFLMGGGCPVYHALQVAEVAHTETLLRAEGEYGYGYAGTFPGRKAEVDVTVADGQCFVGACLRVGHVAVGVVLPSYGTAFFLIIKNELVL